MDIELLNKLYSAFFGYVIERKETELSAMEDVEYGSIGECFLTDPAHANDVKALEKLKGSMFTLEEEVIALGMAFLAICRMGNARTFGKSKRKKVKV